MTGLLPDTRVEVHLPPGPVLPGRITRIAPGRERPIKVVFDDPLVYGGVGAGWFTETEVLPSQGQP